MTTTKQILAEQTGKQICTRCKQMKPLDHFLKGQSWCRQCRTETARTRNRRYYARHRTAIQAKSRERYHRKNT